jgi:hypothetical protein
MSLELLSFTGGHPIQQIGIGCFFRVSGADRKGTHDVTSLARIPSPRKGL